MADDRGPDRNEGAQRPDDETGSGAGDVAGGDAAGASDGDGGAAPGSGEDVTRHDPRDSPFGLPLRGGSRDSGNDPFAGLSGLGGLGGLGDFGGAGAPADFAGGDLGAM